MTEVSSTVPEQMEIESTAAAEVPAATAASSSAEQPAQQGSNPTENDPTVQDSAAEPPAERVSISKRVQEAKEYNDRGRKTNGRAFGDGYRDRHGKGGRKHDGPPKDYSNNIKSNLIREEESSDPVEIRKQVEFYFSDSNLMQDDFLYSKVDGPKNLPVPISVIHSFKRMRHFQPLSVVVAALKDSTTLDIVDNDACIKRKIPLEIPETVKDKPMYEVKKIANDKSVARSIYAKGFGEEGPGTQFELEAFFAEFGTTNSVRLRRHNDKLFKGSVFVEFDCLETQEKFLALDPKPKWKGNDLLVKSKKQYCDEKVEDIEAGRIKPNYIREREENGNKRSRNDDRDWRTRREEDRANGFRDRKGQHKGHQDGRGRAKGGRDWRKERDPPQEQKDEHNTTTPTVRASTSSPTRAGAADSANDPSATAPSAESTAPSISQPEAPATTSYPPESSKKRAREDSDEEKSAPKKAYSNGELSLSKTLREEEERS